VAAVSDASPLIALDYLAQLELLPKLLGGEVLIPPAVAREFTGTEWRRSPLPKWVAIRELKQPIAERILQASLGAGESEGLALATETAAELILLDDKAARHLATALGLRVVGTLGLLLRAKNAGLGDPAEARPIAGPPFHVTPRLYEAVLREAGE
jgi:uncharacterized protein